MKIENQTSSMKSGFEWYIDVMTTKWANDESTSRSGISLDAVAYGVIKNNEFQTRVLIDKKNK